MPCWTTAHAPSFAKRNVLVDLIAVLHGGRVDLCRQAARPHQRRGVDSAALACGLDLERRAARRLSLAARDDEPDVVGDIAQALLQGSTGRRRQTARVPVEAEHRAERLEPKGVRDAREHSRHAVLLDDDERHRLCERSHPLEQPSGGAAPVKGKIRLAGSHTAI
jgi:hypothetical protein